MSSHRKNVFSAAEGAGFRRAVFQRFEGRPVNYFRDVISNGGEGTSDLPNGRELQEKIDVAVQAERERVRGQHEAELQQAFRAGLAKGREESMAQMERAAQLLAEYARVLLAEKAEVAGRCEREAMELAFEVARKIIGRELETTPEAVRDVVKAAIGQVLDCERIRLRVNPRDLQYLRDIHMDLEPIMARQAPVEVRGDHGVEAGGCIIETERGLVDAQPSSQLLVMKSNLESGEAGGG